MNPNVYYGPTAQRMISRDIPMSNFDANLANGLFARNNLNVQRNMVMPYHGTTSNVFCDGIASFMAWHNQVKAQQSNNGDFHLHL